MLPRIYLLEAYNDFLYQLRKCHLFGSAFYSQFQLRYRAFIERQDYDVQIYKGMEYDQYDTPASHYLVYHTPGGQALGVSRLRPRHRAACSKISGRIW
jgi:N-acyl-L-homoserine lactone synthetase